MKFVPDIHINNLTDIYNYVSQETIFKHIFGEIPDLNKKYLSPFREDNNPNCYFKKIDNHLYFVDWADGTIDAIGSIKKKYDLNLNGVITWLKYNFDFEYNKIDVSNNCKLNHKFPTIIYPLIRNWEDRDINYWTKRYGITTLQLEEDNVFPISQFAYRKNDILRHVTPISITYAISSQDKFKIYSPLESKKSKWLSNIPKDHINGSYNDDSKNIIITKSYKDHRVLYNLLNDNVIWLQNEGVIPIQLNTFLEPFNNIIIFYDNDKAGIFAADKLSKSISKETIIIQSDESYLKDISDMYCFKGKTKTSNWLNKKLITCVK
jgi:5S rRNA maturation endonuclease (ribonuclease M5)